MPRVPTLQASAAAAAAAAARSWPMLRRLWRKAVVAPVLWLYHLGEDIIFYGFLAAMMAANLGGIVPEILGRWACGEGSAVSAAGEEVLASSKFIIVRFLPAFVVQLFVRILARARFEAREAKKEKEKRENNEKQTSSTAIRVESSKEQRPESRGARRWGPKGFMPYAIYLAPPLIQLSCLGIKMKAHHEEGSLEWRVGYVLDDFARFTSAILISFVGVPSMLLTAMIPKVKDDDTSSQ
ncbi:uncharacterized protein [Oryza sativa Japonica Group]|uniref:uncharacterized protein isoform X1 n=1 Tax=Oryza sativa subsp. japonica TaxID=39947 RepID=UPI00077555AE|nr:uncharacterized protein LOC107281954 isoform X1 [Oryza sativa Japonica Group]